MVNEPVQSYSITRYLMTYFILTVVTVSLLAIMILYFNINQRAKLDFENSSEETITYLSGSLSLPIWSVNESQTRAIAETVARGDSVVQLEIIDYSRESRLFNFDEARDGQLLKKTKQIFHENEVIGEVRMGFSNSSHMGLVQKNLYVSMLFVSLVLISVLLVTHYIIRKFLKEPFHQLTELVNAYADGKYGKLDLPISSKEFQPLKTLLEQMAERIITQVGSLQESEEALCEAQRIAHIGHWEWDIMTNIITWSEEACRIYGVEPNLQVTFEALQAMIHPADFVHHTEQVALWLENKTDDPLEYRIIQPDGSIRYVYVDAEVTCDEIGKVVKMHGILQDITDRKKAEETLRESESSFRRLIEQSPVSIQVHDLDGKLIKSNDAFARLYALNQDTLDELYEKYSVLDDVQARSIGVMPYIERTYKGEDVIFPPYKYDGVDTLKTLDFSKPVSRKCWIQTYGFALKDENNLVTSTVFFSEDITERKKSEQAILNYQQRLKDLAGELTRTQERERRVIATQLHDDVGQSLALMRIQLAAGLKQATGRKLETILIEVSSSLHQAVDDTRSIINCLSSPTLNELGLSAAISEYLNEQLAKRYNIMTRFSEDEQPKPLDDDSKAILYRNVRELLMNVVKHAQASNVSVMLKREADNIKIVVEDDGVGLDELELSDRKNVEGFGLFSIEESMKDIGGEMTIESKKGQGIRFSLTAPLEDGKTKTI